MLIISNNVFWNYIEIYNKLDISDNIKYDKNNKDYYDFNCCYWYTKCEATNYNKVYLICG